MLKFVALVLTVLVQGLDAMQKNGCWMHEVKSIKHFGCTPNPPRNLCAKCPLDTSNLGNGQFVSCTKMFDVQNKRCKHAIKQYVDRTPCDTETPRAWNKVFLNQGDPDYTLLQAEQTLDRLVYTLCEFCCDCITCGDTQDKTAQQVSQIKGLSRINHQRRNCMLHVPPDNCALFPNFKVTADGEQIDMCTETRLYKKTESSPDPINKATVFKGLLQMTKQYGCARPDAWNACRIMEQHFGRLKDGFGTC